MNITLLNVEQVAEFLQIKDTTVYDLLQNGEIEFYRPGKKYLISKEQLMEYLEKNKNRKKGESVEINPT